MTCCVGCVTVLHAGVSRLLGGCVVCMQSVPPPPPPPPRLRSGIRKITLVVQKAAAYLSKEIFTVLHS